MTYIKKVGVKEWPYCMPSFIIIELLSLIPPYSLIIHAFGKFKICMALIRCWGKPLSTIISKSLLLSTLSKAFSQLINPTKLC